MAFTHSFWRTVSATVLASFAYGYQLGVLNTALGPLAASLQLQIPVQGAFIVGALLAGALASALCAGPLADRIGARSALLWSSVALGLGGLTAAASWDLASLTAGRILSGLGCGVVSLCAPRFLAEVSPPRVRGAIGTLSQLLICCGILAAYCMGLPYAASLEAQLQVLSWSVPWWRVMLGAPPALLSILQAMMLAASCESPVWLRTQGKDMAAREAEQQLGAAEASLPDEGALLTPASGDMSGEAAAPWRAMFSRKYRRLLGLASMLVLLQQLSGINVLIFYSTQVFREAGLQSPILGSILLGVVNIVGTILAAVASDTMGRRPLMITSHAGMAVSLSAIVAATFIPGLDVGRVSLFATFSFVAFFSAGAGPLPFIVMSEILGAEAIKGSGASLATAINWSLNLMVGLSFPMLLGTIGIGGSFLIYAGFNLVGAALCVLFMVETRQRSIEQIRLQLII